MPHSPSFGSGLSSDESDHRLLHLFLHERRGILLVGPADFSYHDNGIRSFVGLESLETVDEVGADDGIAADTHAGALSDTALCEVIHHLIGERATAGDQSDAARRTDVPRDD